MQFFPSSDDIRKWSINNNILNDEIYFINKKILSAASTFSYSVEVKNSFMTTPKTSAAQYYYHVWKRNIIDPVATNQILKIQEFYRNKGYDITIVQNTSSINTFKWIVRW